MTQCSGISRISKLFIQRNENCRYSTWCFSKWRWRLSASTRQHEQWRANILPSIRSRSRTHIIYYWNKNQTCLINFTFNKILKSCGINTSWQQQQDLGMYVSFFIHLALQCVSLANPIYAPQLGLTPHSTSVHRPCISCSNLVMYGIPVVLLIQKRCYVTLLHHMVLWRWETGHYQECH